MEIIINGDKTKVQVKTIITTTYEDIIVAAGYNRDDIISVTYKDYRSGRQGSLIPGQSIEVNDDILFNAMYTGNA